MLWMSISNCFRDAKSKVADCNIRLVLLDPVQPYLKCRLSWTFFRPTLLNSRPRRTGAEMRLMHVCSTNTISQSSKNSNNVGSMCNMSGQCARPGLQLNYFLHSSSSHNRMGDQFSTSSVEQLRLLITD